jgi:hypothetical protein
MGIVSQRDVVLVNVIQLQVIAWSVYLRVIALNPISAVLMVNVLVVMGLFTTQLQILVRRLVNVGMILYVLNVIFV